jgi:NAD(P)H-dependent flavin oxidoreductase YrpB (nitropropane dioxygenase family)
MLRTTLTAQLGIELPLVQAGMGTVGRPALAAAVSAAGALGMLSGLGGLSPDRVRQDIRDVRAAPDAPSAQTSSSTCRARPWTRDLPSAWTSRSRSSPSSGATRHLMWPPVTVPVRW